jgi:hypothetical protein
MMISLYQEQIPQSTLSWRTVYDDLIRPEPDPTIYRSRGEQSMMFDSTRTRFHDLPLSWRTVYDDLIRPEPDPTIYRSRGEQSDDLTLQGPDPTIYRSRGEQS